MAEGYARSTGKVGVALATSGPGATNVVTPLRRMHCWISIPIVVHHRPGADAPHRLGRVPGMRHGRHHARVHQAQLAGARRERPGAHHPRSVSCRALGPPRAGRDRHSERRQFAKGVYVGADNAREKFASSTRREIAKPDPRKIAEALDLMANAKKPVFYTGGGVINSGPHASTALRALVKETGFPITSTLMGLGAFQPPIRNGSACWACTAHGKPINACTIAT